MRRIVASLALCCLGLLAAPAIGHAATVSVSGSTITFQAAPGEANTAVIAQQALPGSYFVGDLSPSVAVTAPSCVPTSAIPGLPAGFLCSTGLGTPSLVENLGDGNDTGVVDSDAGTGTINGDAGDDTLVGGTENDTFSGGADTDSVAYAGVSAANITRTTGVTATLPNGAPSTTGNGQAGESDTIDADVEGLVGGNGNDTLTGNDDANTIVGAAPVGTPNVTTSPAGNDTIVGNGGADTLVAGDSGSVSGGPGADQIVGGRSTAATTVIHGDDDADTIVSGLGDDDIFGDAGANTLAYASVTQGALTVVDRGTSGVTATLPAPGKTAAGGRTGSAEHDTIHPGISTLVGGNGNDVLTGSPGNDTLVGVAPAGTPGVRPGPPGNDILRGGAGTDIMLGAGGSDQLDGGAGPDVFSAGAGNDLLTSRDSVSETPSCGAGTDTVIADALDRPGADCERVRRPGTAATPAPAPPATDRTKPRMTERPRRLVLRGGRRVALYLACRNESKGCRGKLTLRTRSKVKVGRRKARRYTVGSLGFQLRSAKPKRFKVRLIRHIRRLVRRHHTLRLSATVVSRDAAGNRTRKTFVLRLRRA